MSKQFSYIALSMPRRLISCIPASITSITLVFGCGGNDTIPVASDGASLSDEDDASGASGDGTDAPDKDDNAPDSGEIPSDEFLDRLADVHVEMTDFETVISAVDAEGTIIGTLGLLIDDNSVMWLTSDYPDGFTRVGIDAVSFEELVGHDSTLSEELITIRAQAIVDLIQTKPQAKGEWFWCATGVAAATGACAGAAASGGLLLVGCAGLSAAAACKCITAWAVKKGKRKCAE